MAPGLVAEAAEVAAAKWQLPCQLPLKQSEDRHIVVDIHYP